MNAISWRWAARPGDAVGPLIRLRRDGHAPLRFTGGLFGHYAGHMSLIGVWHDLALYATATGTYATAIVAWHAMNSSPTAVRHHAALHETIEAAVTHLEEHDPASDLCPGVSAPDVSLDGEHEPPVSLLLQAAALQAVKQDTLRRYRIGVGAFLATLASRSAASFVPN